MSYPRWKYHRTLEPCIVADPAEEEALGAGWENTPAAFLEPEPAAAEAPIAAEAEPEPKARRPRRKKAE